MKRVFFIWGLAAALIVVEACLLGADLGFWGHSGWRARAYFNGAFWKQILLDWPGNYAGQAWVMFFTYGFLHGGLWHLVFNTITLISLGTPLALRLGAIEFLRLYFLSQFGGAIAFALLYDGSAPMVGASGALFGLAGAYLYENWQRGGGLREVWVPSVILVAINVVMYVALAGQLSWQAHLGGTVAGALTLRWQLRHGRVDPLPLD